MVDPLALRFPSQKGAQLPIICGNRLFNSLVLEYLRKSGRSVYLHTCLPHTATRHTPLPSRPTASRAFLPLTSRPQKCPGYSGNTVTSSGRGTQRSRYSCPWWWLAASPMDCRFLHGSIFYQVHVRPSHAASSAANMIRGLGNV